MRYLLDTNVWIEILKGKNLRVAGKFANTPTEELATCSTVRAELMHGSEKYDDADSRKMDLAITLSRAISLPFDDRYGVIRHDLEQRMCVIGPFDLQIAAVALVHYLTLVTGNMSEFKRVHGLRVEDWSLAGD
jgi:tRNA(fMet)-specific endonuclease VapC